MMTLHWLAAGTLLLCCIGFGTTLGWVFGYVSGRRDGIRFEQLLRTQGKASEARNAFAKRQDMGQ